MIAIISILIAIASIISILYIENKIEANIRKNKLKDKLSLGLMISTRRQVFKRTCAVIAANHRDKRNENKRMFQEFIKDIHRKLKNFIDSMVNQKINEIIENVNQYLEFCKVRKGNGPNVKRIY